MTYNVKISIYAEKKLKKLGAAAEKQVLNYLKNVVSKLDEPTLLGKALVGNLSGKWRYRTGNYRIICEIRNDELTVLVVDVSHRRNAYR
jgi:mRNA interferase RelE/StbE